MATCKRCGIQFAGATEWCEDCRDVEEVAVHWPHVNDYVDQVQRDRWALIEPYYQEGKYDYEIAALLGLGTDAVQKVRAKANKPANKRADRYAWKDQHAQAVHMKTMVRHRNQSKRGTLVV